MEKYNLFSRWTWITEEEFRDTFGYQKDEVYPSHKILSSIHAGCERTDSLCGGLIIKILDDKEFPHGLTKLQEDTVREAAAWFANYFLVNHGGT